MYAAASYHLNLNFTAAVAAFAASPLPPQPPLASPPSPPHHQGWLALARAAAGRTAAASGAPSLPIVPSASLPALSTNQSQ